MDIYLDPLEILKDLFTEDHSQMIVVKKHRTYSMCEHHMLPFFVSTCSLHPNGKIVVLVKYQELLMHLKNARTIYWSNKDCIQEALSHLV
jgi:GTP cyclohydrolase I